MKVLVVFQTLLQKSYKFEHCELRLFSVDGLLAGTVTSPGL